MGDFERTFGAGADVESIIAGYNREHFQASNRERSERRGASALPKTASADQVDEFAVWCSKMTARGYSRGPSFRSYDEMAEWDKCNKRAHIRRRNGDGFVVFFTD